MLGGLAGRHEVSIIQRQSQSLDCFQKCACTPGLGADRVDVRLNRVADPCSGTLRHAPCGLFSCKCEIGLKRALGLKHPWQTSQMFAAKRDAELECVCKRIAVLDPYCWIGVVYGTLRGIDADLNKHIGNTQLCCVQIMQDVRGILTRRRQQVNWGEMRVTREQADVYIIEAEQSCQTQRIGSIQYRECVICA